MLPGLGHDDELIGACARHQALDARLRGRGGTDDCLGGHAVDVHLLRLGPDSVHVLYRGCERRVAAHHTQEVLLLGRVQVTGSLVGIGEHRGHTHHDIGLGQMLGGLEIRAVGIDGLL